MTGVGEADLVHTGVRWCWTAEGIVKGPHQHEDEQGNLQWTMISHHPSFCRALTGMA
jgi:hypothetical protein